MNCQRCQSKRITKISAKCDDRCHLEIGSSRRSDSVPCGFGIGAGDYLQFSYCLDCGQIQGKFPLSQTELEVEQTLEAETVCCRFCNQQVPLDTAHYYRDSYVGDECCWDDRLRMSE